MKKSLLLALMLSLCTWVWPASITIEQAHRLAQQFLVSKGVTGSLQQTQSPSARKRSARLGTADYYYVFNVSGNKGYVIVSGDDSAPVVLGYSTHGSFDADRIPSNMAAWLQGYADRIEAIGEGTQTAGRRAVRKAHAAVAPLIATKWDQGDPYNMYLPEYKTGRKSATGCSSTAMAQIMKFHGHPSSCAGVAGFTTTTNKIKVDALPATTFDWGSMTDTYSGAATDGQRQAVGRLLQYVSAALEADYNAESSVWDNKLVPALTDVFGYSNSAEFVRKTDNIADSEWDNLIYHEIANGRPVLYSGQSTDGNGGHSFIVHGYDGSGYYAVNWGWSGSFDGYFLLSDMSPGGTGVGGGSGHYNYMQSAVIGISPTSVEKYTIQEEKVLTAYGIYVGAPSQTMTQILNMTSTDYDGVRDAKGNISLAYNFRWASFLAYDYAFSVGYAVLRDGAVVGDVVPLGNINISPNSWSCYYGTMSFGSGLDDGNYQLRLFSKYGTDDWKPCLDPDNDYTLTMQVTSTNVTFKKGASEPAPEPAPEVTDADREALTALFDTVRKSVSEKMTAATAVSEKLKTIEAGLSNLKADISALNEQVSTVEAKISDDHLTAAQKESYTVQLNALKTQLKDTSDKLSSMLAEEQSLQSNASTRNATLSKLSDDITKAASEVGAIATKDALDAAMAKAAELDKEQGAVNVAEDDQRITSLEAALGAASVAAVNDGLTVLSGTIDAAIAEAIAAAEEEARQKEQEEKMREAKETFDKALADLTATIERQTGYYEQNVAYLSELKAKVAEIEEQTADIKATADNIAQMIDDLKSADIRSRASEEDIRKCQDAYDALKDDIDHLEANAAILKDMIEKIEAQLVQVKTEIDETADLRDKLAAEAAGLTSADEVKGLARQASEQSYLLEDWGTNASNTVIKNLNTLISNVNIVVNEVNAVSTETDRVYTQVTYATSIEGIVLDEAEVEGRYDLQGRRVDSSYRGVQIVRLKNGTTYKIHFK